MVARGVEGIWRRTQALDSRFSSMSQTLGVTLAFQRDVVMLAVILHYYLLCISLFCLSHHPPPPFVNILHGSHLSEQNTIVNL